MRENFFSGSNLEYTIADETNFKVSQAMAALD
jgi:hypothetical protein